MDSYVKQICCLKATTDGSGKITYTFSLDVLVPNLLCAAVGYLSGHFIFADMILNKGGK